MYIGYVHIISYTLNVFILCVNVPPVGHPKTADGCCHHSS
jgi:hypothetical protein